MTNTMTTLSNLGLISVAGTDAHKFLQGQLTCDLNDISASQTRLGAHCNPQGRVISLFRLFWFKDQYLLQMPRELIPIAMTALQKYAVFFKVTLSDVSNAFKQYGYRGSGFTTNADDAIITQVHGQESRYIIISTVESPAIHAESTWHCQDIAAGLPAIYPETSEKFLPHELNLPALNAVSFKKGCYTGQEIIARMEYRGKLKNHLYYARVNSMATPQCGNDIYRQKDRAGSIVDVCQVGYNLFDLLVIASENDAASGELSLDTEGTPLVIHEAHTNRGI